MASVQFSWSDSLHAAVSSCLPCFKHPDSDSEDAQPPRARHPHPAFAHAIPPPRARPDELEGLLADASDDADALSLHTNPGERRTRKKRRKQPKHIRVFGFDLFGRAPPPIQLPESDDEDSGSGRLRPGGEGERARKISTSTLDSDAAPLDASRIEELSAARNAEALAREEDERRAKEERRRRRRERRELKRAAIARALELQANGGEEFEGFQGSGPAYGPTSPFSPSVGSGTGTLSDSVTSSQQQHHHQQQHEFGPFAHGQPVEPFDPDAAEAAREAAEAEADGADFGGESYTACPHKSTSRASHGAGTGTMSTSDTRSSSSRGTGSHGYAAPYNHQFLASLHAPGAGVGVGAGAPRPPLSPLSQDGDADSAPPSPHVTERSKKRRKSKSASAAKSLSVSTSSQSASATTSSLTSPPPSAPLPLSLSLSAAPHGDAFEGFPGDFGNGDVPAGGALVDLRAGEGADKDEDAQAQAQAQAQEEEEVARRSAYVPVARFPSAGFGRTASRSSNSNSDAGVFLARRGDE